MDAQRLEDILTEIGRQIVDRGLTQADTFDASEWGCATLTVELCPENLGQMVNAGACRLGVCGPDPVRLGEVASYLDHTLLKPDATVTEIDKLCSEALEHRFASVCVNGSWVRRCSEILEASGVLVCSVIGFPLGAMASEVKAYEARRAIEDGACEIDMVLAIGALKSGDDAFVQRDIAGVAETCHGLKARLKVILETCLLTEGEIERACRLAKAAGADFVKTSTGFSKGGATIDDVELMRRTVGPAMGVKASGGVRDSETAKAMIAAGATRIGASASIAISQGGKGTSSY
ncbi:MAG: deoxyribose-phosphate aldolase [Planctomycetota bacterium]|jgi:deoxyribose-phosphate aldolase